MTRWSGSPNLVHHTNNALGMREMKEAMVGESEDMTFWPVTVRPPDQLALEVAEEKPYLTPLSKTGLQTCTPVNR